MQKAVCRQCLDSIIDMAEKTQKISFDLDPVVADLQGYLLLVSLALDTALQNLSKAAYQLEKAMER